MNEIEACLKYGQALPSIPAAALNVIALAWKPEVHVSELASAIAGDPALMVKLLRAANSPLYRRAQEYKNLTDALRLLGFKRAVSIALTFSMVSMAAEPATEYGFRHEMYWRRSLLAALSCRALGTILHRNDNEDLFLVALLQDVGSLALNDLFPDIYESVQIHGHGDLVNAEVTRLGIDHAYLGARLLQQWGVPEAIATPVSTSHDLAQSCLDTNLPLFSRLVVLSGQLADMWITDNSREAVFAVARNLHILAGLEQQAVAEVIGVVARELPQYEALLERTVVNWAMRTSILDQAREAATLLSESVSSGAQGKD